MGCDIHAFIEFEKFETYWSLTETPLNIPRDYKLFSVLAFGDGGYTDDLPHPPRGLPSNLSFDVRYYFYTPVEEVMKQMESTGWQTKKFNPEEYLQDTWESAAQEYSQYRLLPTPEFHTHSWLTLDELKESLSYGHLTKKDISPEFCAIIAGMEELAARYGKGKVRLVFSFDGAG
jgi:hypothetical protein